MNTLDNAGVHRLLEAALSTIYFSLLHLAVYTGLRRSELIGLQWSDIDLDLATLSVVRVMHRIRGKGVQISPPKTKRSRRKVALSPNAVLAIRARKEEQEAEQSVADYPWGAESLIFSRFDGSPLRPDTVTHAFADISKCAGLEGIRLHDLRHTDATLMMEQGENPKVVSERLGHAGVGIALDNYGHVSPTFQAAAALRSDETVSSPAEEREVDPE